MSQGRRRCNDAGCQGHRTYDTQISVNLRGFISCSGAKPVELLRFCEPDGAGLENQGAGLMTLDAVTWTPANIVSGVRRRRPCAPTLRDLGIVVPRYIA
ncbi:hypothetical protein NDU88_003610 [Pleurodeles waltl]|uniref:Uncharacterized protein n=1 Tax=Pleurodeles waltl TaxID=8319 RepID=A0AAV7UCY7_PLEWA|nr:hypothetical protein NDU88_003610 [Pleurodeles waltl]